MTLQAEDFDNAKLDLQFISKVANVDYNGNTATNRDGIVSDTVKGRLLKLGYLPPIAYAASISFGVMDNMKTIERLGVVYAPKNSALPFTTTGTWATDDDNFFTVQDTGAVTALQADVADLVTLTGQPANSTTLGNLTGDAEDIIGDNQTIKAGMISMANVVGAQRRSNWRLLQTISPNLQSEIDITLDPTLWRAYMFELSGIAPSAGAGSYLKLILDDDQGFNYSANTCTHASAFTFASGLSSLIITPLTVNPSDRMRAEIIVRNMLSTAFTTVEINSSGTTAVGNGFTIQSFANYKILSQNTKLTLKWNSQAFKNQGEIKVYAT